MNKTPIGGLWDERFVYVPAAQTNIRETFKRVSAQLKREMQARRGRVAAKGERE